MLGEGHDGLSKPQKRKKEGERQTGESGIRTSLLMLDLKEGKLWNSGKEEDKRFQKNWMFLG